MSKLLRKIATICGYVTIVSTVLTIFSFFSQVIGLNLLNWTGKAFCVMLISGIVAWTLYEVSDYTE